jgi:hypothetical protein
LRPPAARPVGGSSTGAEPSEQRALGSPSGSSQRVSTGGRSIPKSERPDLSWLDEAENNSPETDEPQRPSPNTGQTITYAILGLLGGGVLGGMLSIVLASIVSTECFADQCILRYLAGCAAVGAVVGIFVGLRLARQAANADAPPTIGR